MEKNKEFLNKKNIENLKIKREMERREQQEEEILESSEEIKQLKQLESQTKMILGNFGFKESFLGNESEEAKKLVKKDLPLVFSLKKLQKVLKQLEEEIKKERYKKIVINNDSILCLKEYLELIGTIKKKKDFEEDKYNLSKIIDQFSQSFQLFLGDFEEKVETKAIRNILEKIDKFQSFFTDQQKIQLYEKVFSDNEQYNYKEMITMINEIRRKLVKIMDKKQKINPACWFIHDLGNAMLSLGYFQEKLNPVKYKKQIEECLARIKKYSQYDDYFYKALISKERPDV